MRSCEICFKRAAIKNGICNVCANPTRHKGPAFYNTFDEYAVAFPEGESFRRWLTNDGRRDVALIHAGDTAEHNQLPGGYNWAHVGSYPSNTGNDRSKPVLPWWVHINDCDDWGAKKLFATQAEAEKALEELKLLAPVSMKELIDMFGYKND